MNQNLIYEKLLTRLSGKALLIDHNYLSLVASFLPGSDLSVDLPPMSLATNLQDIKRSQQTLRIINGTACIPVRGMLFQHFDWLLSAVLDVSFYEIINDQFQAALSNPNVKRITFDCDSHGGEVCGCFDLADEIFKARGKKPIYAIVNEMAYSGAYAIASASDKVFLPRTASLGSIGVISTHLDESKRDEKRGIKYTTIYAGGRKNDFSRHAPLSSAAVDALQNIVKEQNEIFVSTVARNRGISPQAIRNMEAALFFGKNAVDVGLADRVTSYAQALKTIEQSTL